MAAGGSEVGEGFGKHSYCFSVRIFGRTVELSKFSADSFLSQLLSITSLDTNVNFHHYCPDKVGMQTLLGCIFFLNYFLKFLFITFVRFIVYSCL